MYDGAAVYTVPQFNSGTIKWVEAQPERLSVANKSKALRLI
jgi:hypothetical protein